MLQLLLPGAVESALAVVAGWLLTYAAYSTVLLGGAWLLDRRTAATRPPRRRHLLWTAAAFGAVVAATAHVAGGLGPRVTVHASEAEKLVVEFPPTRVDVRTDPAAPAYADRGAGGGGAGSGELRRPHASAVDDPATWLGGLAHDWPFLLALGWLLIAGLRLLHRSLQWWRLARRLGSRKPISSGRLRDCLDGIAAEAGEHRAIRLSRTAEIPGPVVLPGREICLPDRVVTALDREATRALLAHEAAHVLRGDTQKLVLLSLVESLLFFQPLNRLARRRAGEAAEMLSDDWVGALGLGPALADCLVTVAAWVRSERPEPHLAGAADPSDVERRVRRLLGSRCAGASGPPAASSIPLALGCVALLALVFPGAEVGLRSHAPTSVTQGREIDGGGAGARVRWAQHGAPWSLGRTSLDGPESVLLPRLEALAAGPGTGLYVQMAGISELRRLTVRPGDARVRLLGPAGWRATGPAPTSDGDGAPVHAVRVEDGPPGRYELFVPRGIRRILVEVDGRVLTARASLSGDELPAILSSG